MLELGNQILTVLGAEQEIEEIETFTSDSLYLQLFEVIFPQFNFEDVEQGNTPEEMAENIQGLLSVLGSQVLDMDLSFIEAKKIVDGDLKHMQNFLQLIMDVVLLLAQKQQEEEEEEAEEDPKAALREQLDKEKEEEGASPEKGGESGSNKDETDTQKLANDMGLKEPGSAKKEESDDEPKLDFYGADKEPEQIVDDDLEEEMHKEEEELDQMIKEHKEEKPKIDVFNDPLLPEDDDFRGGSAKKRGRSGSFGGGGGEDLDSEEDIAFEDLDPDEKYQVLQHLYEEYQRDPDNFPEDQRLLLE